MTQNEYWIQQQIALKTDYNKPFYATARDIRLSPTDMDHFPYKRFFRGVYDISNPIVMEREAGFRPRRDAAYKFTAHPNVQPVSYCWQFPCSSIKPCTKDKDEDKEKSKTECLNYFTISP